MDHEKEEEGTSLDPVGLVSIIVFYVIVMAAGIHASRRKGALSPTTSDDLLLAGRSVGLALGICTLTATQVGGAFLNGSAEEMYLRGLLWCLVPFAYSSSMALNGIFFAEKLRKRGYVTVFDPLQETYGRIMGGLCFLPHLIGDLFWVGAILSVLGSTLVVVVGLDRTTSILASAAVSIGYTLLGGMYSVAYTDVLQLVLVAIGMFLSIPFVLGGPAVMTAPSFPSLSSFMGTLSANETGVWLDGLLVPLLGGLPWQAYYQRVLSMESPRLVRPLSLCAAAGALLFLIPPITFGGAARIVDWNATALGRPLTDADAPLILPLTLRYLTPQAISFLGMGALSAAVVSSVDSAVLGSASALTKNIYQQLVRPKATEKELILVTRIGILLVGCGATGIAFVTQTVYGLWYLSADLVYVVVFPHFIVALCCPSLGNTAGSVASFVVGVLLRLLLGEPILNLPPAIILPSHDKLPLRTIAMLASATCLICVSFAARQFAYSRGSSSSSMPVLKNWKIKSNVIENGTIKKDVKL